MIACSAQEDITVLYKDLLIGPLNVLQAFIVLLMLQQTHHQMELLVTSVLLVTIVLLEVRSLHHVLMVSGKLQTSRNLWYTDTVVFCYVSIQKVTDLFSLRQAAKVLFPLCFVMYALHQTSADCQSYVTGYYMNTSQAAVCESCPPGYYCVDSAIWPELCPSGRVCSGNTGYNNSLCPQVIEFTSQLDFSSYTHYSFFCLSLLRQ